MINEETLEIPPIIVRGHRNPPPQPGTATHYRDHFREGTPVCLPCKIWHAKDMRKWRRMVRDRDIEMARLDTLERMGAI